MEIEKTVELKNNKKNLNDLPKKQESFLGDMLGKAINSGVDLGIRVLFPDFIEDHIINIKNQILNFDLKDMISKVANGLANIGKSANENILGNFTSIKQIENAIQKSDLLDTLSNVIDNTLEKAKTNGEIDSDLTELIKQGKNVILDSVENNIENSFSNQLAIEDKLNKYIDNWKKAYKNQDFKNMEKQFNNINKELANFAPLEKAIKEVKAIENIHTLIKTNGQNFNLTETEKKLLKKLS